MRAVLVSIGSLQIFEVWERKLQAALTAAASGLLRRRCRLRCFVRRMHQCDAGFVPNNMGQLGVVAKLQGEGIILTLNNDCLPPAVMRRLMGDHEIAWLDLVPCPRHPAGVGRLWMHQGDAGPVPDELWQVAKIAILEA